MHASMVDELSRLVASAGEYAVKWPEAAELGGWWWTPEPATTPPAEPAMLPGEGREAAVLVLFCLGPSSGAGTAAAGAGDVAPPYVLVTERSRSLAKHPGQVAFPGGAVEAFDADPTAAALREAHEEIGLEPSRVEVIGQLPPAPVPVSGFMVTPVVGVVRETGVLVPQVGEVEAVIRVPVPQLVDPVNRSTSVIHRHGTTHRAPAFLVGGTLIWGFTGILLDRILSRLGWEEPWDQEASVDPREYQPLF
ncbi:CoA pyrophosphatase [Nesterenkonia sp. HG001]|uniref:NUDIX hydrolase n=1 Tax=Nesterenkonia sp. HG001 TaxID=2983207 RepID=UPI002AC5328D|nr:CoA pyrophosphatase [Nesterenkonia sp. HG001]MDZ5077076.1 CoA pyrophosphatase [Nesterenkonia sp. HG001]